MIAISIGFYLIMPTLFSVAYYFTQQSLNTQLNQESNLIQAYGAGNGAELNAISSSSPLAQSIQNIKSTMGAYWLSVLFYPSLIIAITYASIIQIAEFIGGMTHTSMSRLSR